MGCLTASKNIMKPYSGYEPCGPILTALSSQDAEVDWSCNGTETDDDDPHAVPGDILAITRDIVRAARDE